MVAANLTHILTRVEDLSPVCQGRLELAVARMPLCPSAASPPTRIRSARGWSRAMHWTSLPDCAGSLIDERKNDFVPSPRHAGLRSCLTNSHPCRRFCSDSRGKYILFPGLRPRVRAGKCLWRARAGVRDGSTEFVSCGDLTSVVASFQSMESADADRHRRFGGKGEVRT